ncbi:MAG: hypothetical protein ABSF10_18420 [Verrucomicrobiota bacterium]
MDDASTLVVTHKLPHTMCGLYFPMQNWLKIESGKSSAAFLPEQMA